VNPAEVHDLLERYGALQRGHFRLSSGRHSDTYVQCARVLQFPRITASLADALAARWRPRPEVVVSPALGAILIGYAVADALGARFVFTERVEGRMALRRGQELRRGERALVVEDVVTTGGSAAEVLALVHAAGAEPAGVAALVDRMPSPPPFRLEALLAVKARAWTPEECPLCARGEPLVTPGSRLVSSSAPDEAHPS
jgi:orotate phosphoribosyltransferase